MKRKLFFLIISGIMFASCFSDETKQQMSEQMGVGMKMMADMHFKQAISQIELHKVRTGEYPASLKDLQFLSAMDSSFFSAVQYIRLDTVYELNIIEQTFPSVAGIQSQPLELTYPPEFWKGLGCVRSNTMK